MVVLSGNTGGSTGPHADVRIYDPATGDWIDPRPYLNRFTSGGAPLSEGFQTTSPYGMRTHSIHGDRRMHHGVDLATPVETPISFEGGTFAGYKHDSGGGGWMGGFQFQNEDGNPLEAWVLHATDPGAEAKMFEPGNPASVPEPASSNAPAPRERYTISDLQPVAGGGESGPLLSRLSEDLLAGKDWREALGVKPLEQGRALPDAFYDEQLPVRPATRGALGGVRTFPSAGADALSAVRRARGLRAF